MDAAAKQQIVERVKQATNVLVTVSNNPTVDQLASCIGLTLLLNKMGKHATAVFSGKVPSTIEFLQPEKTLETNTDSLRDFIISLDKNKADKLRYKVEDQYVRIFISPYRTSLSEKDLVFSQGDFNVEVVMALGIKQREDLDKAITAHGRILHDATVISVNAGDSKAPDLGQINWQEPTASSLAEMLVSISEAFGTGLIDAQMATAFLTGIVAETRRFANQHTTPKVMTISAQLMAAGANQQLIAAKLEPEVVINKPATAPVAKPKPKAVPDSDNPDIEGTLKVDHKKETKDDTNKEVEVGNDEIHIDEQGNLKTKQEIEFEEKPSEHQEPEEEPPIPPPAAPTSAEPALPEATPLPPAQPKRLPDDPVPPSKATNQHKFLGTQSPDSMLNTPFTASSQNEWADPYNTVSLDPLSEASHHNDEILSHSQSVKPSADDVEFKLPEMSALTASAEPKVPEPSAPISPPTTDVNSARSAVESAIAGAPFDPAFGAPAQNLNADFMADNLHQSALPTDSTNDIAPPAPPPVPPPLMPNPGLILPNSPNNT
jgi:hypothetical protein